MSQVLTAQASPPLTVWVRLLRAHAEITRAFNRQLIADHGLTINDYEVLVLLSRAPDERMRRVDLADEVSLTASGMTRLLDGLQAAGLVDKATCSSDARVTYAVLTPAGQEKLEEASTSHLAAVAAFFEDRYGAAELQKLADLLGRLPGASDADPDSCSP